MRHRAQQFFSKKIANSFEGIWAALAFTGWIMRQALQGVFHPLAPRALTPEDICGQMNGATC
jgi:hypothetical protein